jgi:hypothetical protein
VVLAFGQAIDAAPQASEGLAPQASVIYKVLRVNPYHYKGLHEGLCIFVLSWGVIPLVD